MLILSIFPQTETGMILLIPIILLILSIYGFFRNFRVLKFRTTLINMTGDWCRRHIDDLVKETEVSAFEWFFPKLPSYAQMMFSFRPLKLEEWASEEDIKKLKS